MSLLRRKRRPFRARAYFEVEPWNVSLADLRLIQKALASHEQRCHQLGHVVAAEATQQTALRVTAEIMARR